MPHWFPLEQEEMFQMIKLQNQKTESEQKVPVYYILIEQQGGEGIQMVFQEQWDWQFWSGEFILITLH